MDIKEKLKVKKGDPNYDLLNQIWLGLTRQKEYSLEEIDKVISKLSDMAGEKQTSFTITPDNFVDVKFIGDKTVLVGFDDYGQCYYFEWEEDGYIRQASCGTYNYDYDSEIEAFFESKEEQMKHQLRFLQRAVFELRDEMNALRGGEDSEGMGKRA